MSELETILRKLEEFDWHWTKLWWFEEYPKHGLIMTEKRGNNETYLFDNHTKITAYFLEDRLVSVQVTLHSEYVECGTEEDSITQESYEEKFGGFVVLFEGVTSELIPLLGQPNILAMYGDNDFPVDQDCAVLALWEKPSARLMLQVRNEGFEYPFRLMLVVESDEVFED